ncbi:CoA transferase [Aestuariicella hydrocarbonica]|uniref:CoA transferase n=1 Tax=Pseudomaricurvus hydrocarbonicus TaxID=1470433 RepID=A0A9E5MML2_9GAMM|nr:CaiB/BaiF CoA-transferase family protein [Aestuariicella hydrocarbonica]NHO67016.1 CoA transferase [Aestuariicella hydrocarbonica]
MGPLSGYRVIELAGLGPCPMAGMLLADMGAEVICIDRGGNLPPLYTEDMSRRGKKSIVVNLKSPQGRETLLQLIATADVLIEGFRPGVTEKLGIGPQDCHAVNPALVYGRMTGWGQTGPLAHNAGHDINYISITGALHAIGVKGQKPVVPLNLVGDFGGGTMFLVSGVLAALLEAKNSGKGQVVDAAMVDGAANLMWMCHSFHASNMWNFNERGVNMLDGGAFYYDTYETADGKYVAIGAIEPQFFTTLVEKGGLDPDIFNLHTQNDADQWDAKKAILAEVIKQKSRDEWCALLENTDACFSPVLTAHEAFDYPHNRERDAYIELDGYKQPAPAPRFSRTRSEVRHGQHPPGHDTRTVLEHLGLSGDAIQTLLEQGAVE